MQSWQRQSIFDGALKEAGLESRLGIIERPMGLGLTVLEHFEVGSEILCCDPLLIYTPGPLCKKIEDLRAALPHPALLPLPCYCAALATFRSTPAAVCQKQLFALSRPESIALRAPGMEALEFKGDSQSADATAMAIARAFDIPEALHSSFSELAKIWRCNAFELTDGQLGIFLVPALCNHSCNPAAEYRIDSQDEEAFTITLTACRQLIPGDELTISYIAATAEHEPSRTIRRKALASGWFFFCCCSACGISDGADQLGGVGSTDGFLCSCPACSSCGCALSIWISDVQGGPYEDTGEAPTCDTCGEIDLVVSGSYFFHCSTCEVDLCPECGDKAEIHIRRGEKNGAARRPDH